MKSLSEISGLLACAEDVKARAQVGGMPWPGQRETLCGGSRYWSGSSCIKGNGLSHFAFIFISCYLPFFFFFYLFTFYRSKWI